MENVKEKLTGCFALVFPDLDPAQYETASAQNMGDWDSIAQLRLLTAIGEAFDREIDFEEFEGATSFEALEKALQVQ
jgi:acyl carrier protein